VAKEEKIERLRRMLEEEGLSEKQVKAGVRYYKNFGRKFDWNIFKSKKKFLKCLKNMRKGYGYE